MAHAISRGLPSRLRSGVSILQKRVECPAVRPDQFVPVATLIPTHGAKYEYAKPWNYKTLPFNLMKSAFFPLFAMIDYPRKRLNPNSKLIVVEGNIGVGKNEFAQRLAKEFDLLYVPSVSEKEALRHPNGFDFRDLNGGLYEVNHFYDLEHFYSDPNPKERQAKMTYLQQFFFLKRCYNYAQAVVHILSTGQGVILTSSMFGDAAYTHALNQMQMLAEAYITFNENGIGVMHTDGFRPHATIYLDSPVSAVRENIKARNDPKEVKSSVLSDEYLQLIEDGYRNEVLPSLLKSGEVIDVEWTKFDESAFKDVVHELSELDLEHVHGEERFKDWDINWLKMNWKRRIFACLADDVLDSHNEMVPDEVLFHPTIKYQKGWAKELGDNTTFKLH